MDSRVDSAGPHDPGLLAAYAEGRLDAGERRAITEHLAACADCRAVVAMLARMPGALPQARTRRPIAAPVWLAVAASVVLATVVVRQGLGPAGAPPAPASTTPAEVTTRPEPPPSASPAKDVEPPSTAPAIDPLAEPGLLVKRGGGRREVAGRTFRRTGGAWVDVAFDDGNDRITPRPTVDVRGAAERAAIVARLPVLAPYAALGDRVIVVVDGTVYRFSP